MSTKNSLRNSGDCFFAEESIFIVFSLDKLVYI